MISIRPRSVFLRLSLLPLFVLMLAVVSYAQKPSKPAPAPAKPAAPAAKPASPPKTGGATTPHTGTAGGAARPGTTGATGTRGGTTAGGAAKGGTTAAGGTKGGAPGTSTAHGTTAGGAAKGGTTAAGGTKGGAAGTATARGGTTAGGAAKGGTTAGGAAGAGKGGAAGAAGATGGATAAKTPGTVTHPGGGKTVTTAAGHTKEFNKSGKLSSVSTKSGHEAHFDSHGHVTSVHTRGGATISHGPHGERRVVGERTNARGEHYRVVNYGGHRGYVEHGYMRGGHPYMRRTYMYGGRRYAYAYRGGYYRGVAYYGYAAPYYYPPAYYGWAYNPWPAPVAYGWGWGASPWYGFYGGYFAPAPVYPIAALWLTDYLIAENLRLAYEASQAADPNAYKRPEFAPYMVASGATADGVTSFGDGMEFNADAAAAALSPDVKQLVSDDLKAQLAEVQAEAANPSSASGSGGDEVPAALNPKHRIFVVSATLDVPSGDDTCALTPGDIVQRQENEPGDDKAVAVKVLSAKSEGCAVGSVVRIQVTDLQDMHNDFREKLDTGLDTLAKGGNGLPKAPDATHKINPDGQAQPDLNADDDLKAQQADADAADKEVQAAAQPDKP
jgi:hypothetical protein